MIISSTSSVLMKRFVNSGRSERRKMNAKICDICGKTFILGLGGKDHHVLGHVVRNEIMFKRYEAGKYLNWDICDDCIDAFDAWVRNRMRENNHA